MAFHEEAGLCQIRVFVFPKILPFLPGGGVFRAARSSQGRVLCGVSERWTARTDLSPFRQGSGASVELADKAARTVISLRFSSLAGAFLVGVAGAKWISGEVDERLLTEGVQVALESEKLPTGQSLRVTQGSPRQILHNVKEACEACAAPETA
jgi:hypothetical protein